MNNRHQTELVHEGQYVAEVDVEFTEPDAGWGPYLSVADAQKLDQVRQALRMGDLVAAGKLGRVFRLTPVTV